MSSAIRQRQSHQKCFNSQDVAELRDDRNGAAFADDRWLFSEHRLQSALRGFAELRTRIGEIPRSAAPARDLHRHSGWQMFLQVVFGQTKNVVAILVRD